jgi:signal transduction histidine kinase
MNLDVYKDEFKSNIELEKMYQLFYTEITRLNKLSNQINQYSRHSEAIPININIYNFFESIRENTFKKVNEKEIKIKNHTLDSTVKGDYTRLHTAFLSLFNYLVDSLEKNSLIEITSQLMDETINISIIFNNDGNSAVDMDPIIIPSYSANISGSGLSLLIFKQLITDLGGSVNFLSSPNNDSRLDVQLPYELNG